MSGRNRRLTREKRARPPLYQKGDEVILRGTVSKNTGIIVEYNVEKLAYIVDRGYKKSLVWVQNIVGKK